MCAIHAVLNANAQLTLPKSLALLFYPRLTRYLLGPNVPHLNELHPRPRCEYAQARRAMHFDQGLGSKVQSIDTISALKFSIRTSHWAFPTKGLSKTKISVCALLSSNTFFRLPKRVFNDITRYSRKLSIGGFVT